MSRRSALSARYCAGEPESEQIKEMATMMNNSGDLTGKILGTCTLERLVGQGGMGAVYLARQSRPSRYVAVKVLLPRISMSSAVYQAFLARFQREADLIARLE